MATRVIAAQDKTSSGVGDDVQIKAGSANTSGAGGSIIIQPGAQATSGGDGIVIVRQPSGTAGTDEIQLLHNGSRGSIINKDGTLQLGGANIAIRNAANNANTTLTATTLYATGIYSSNVINADGVTNDSYSWGIDDSSFNWNQGFNLRVGWSHIRGYANCGIAYTGNNTNGRRATLEVTDGSTGGGAWAYRSATTTVNTSYNDLNLAGHSAFQRLNATAATTITGIAPASTAGGSGFPTWIHTDGRIFWLYNVGTFNITLANESASSTAGNRVTTQTGANVILGPGRMMQIVYDGTSSRWRTSGETYPYVFPTTDGTNGQVLTTNGSGTLSWTTVSAGATASGTTGYLAKFTASSTLGNSQIYENATGVAIGTTSPSTKFHVYAGTGLFETGGISTKGLIVKGASGQTANLQDWQDSAGTVLASVNSLGRFTGSWTDTNPQLDLNFALNKSLTPSVGPTPSFTRASTGTYFNASGVLTTAAINVPRFDHVYNGSSWVSKGLLVEEQRVNYVKYATDLSTNWANEAGATREYNSIVSPDGGTNATKVNVAVSGFSGIYQFPLLNGGSGTYTYSIFAKKGTKDWLVILNAAGSGSSPTFFNISNGTIGTVFSGYSATISDVGNGWYRCILTTASSTTPSWFQIAFVDANNSVTPASTGYSYVYGAQVELGAFPTSYIPTTSTQLARSADVCQITGSDFSGFWNATEGTFATEGYNSINIGVGSSREFAIVGAEKTSTSNEAVTIWKRSSDGLSASVTTVAGLNPALIYGSSAWADGATGRVAFGFKLNDYASSFNGSAVSTDTSGVMPSGLEELAIGYLRNSGGSIGTFFNGHISRLRYFNTRLSNNKLVELSSSNTPLVGGNGTTNYLAKFTGSNTIADSLLYTSSVAQLHVTSAAAATKGLIVKGASGQTANLFELQNNSGTALVSANAIGVGISTDPPSNSWYKLLVANSNSWFSKGVIDSSPLYANADIILGSIATSRPGLGSLAGSHIMMRTSDVASISATNETNGGILSYQNLKWTIGADAGWGVQAVSVPGTLLVGAASSTAKAEINTGSTSTRGLVVKGVASQSANLTEWQDNTGAVVAAVSPTGAFTGSSFTPYGTFNSTTTIFGNNYWTPNYTGGVTSPSAGTYTKSTGSANVWNGQVYSSEGYTKNVYCAARASQTNGHIMFGLNSDPATDGNYTSLDYAWYFLDSAILVIYENGVQVASYGAYTTSTVLSITYDGSNVQYWKDGVIQRTVARSTGNPLYFDTSFYTLSSSLNSVQFGPIGQPFGISGTSGYLPKFTSQQTLGNSVVYDNGTNVGIGTASPADRLEVSGATNKNVKIGTVAGGLDTSSYNPDISTLGGIVGFQTGISTDYRGSIYAYADSSSNAKLAISSRSDIVFVSYKGNNADSRAMVIKETTGNVGIGTASPNMALHVVGAKAGDANEGQGQLNVESTAAYNATNGTVFSTSGAGGSVLFRGKYNSGGAVTGFAGIAGSKENTTDGHYGGNLRFYTRANGANDPPERMRIDASGNVGIGTTTMNDTLNIYNATYPYIRLTGSSATAGMRIGVESTSFAQIGVYQANMPLTFSTSGTSSNLYNERMRISHDGLVGIGSSSPGAKLQLDTGATGTKGQIIKAFLGQAANLSEWQDSNGNILAYVSPNASIISTPAVCSIGSNGNDGGVLKLYSAGFGLRITSLNGDIISGNVNSVNITPGAGGNTIGLNVSCNMGASGVVAQFANNGNVASKVVVVKGIANQSGSLQDWQNSAGTALAYMDANGNFFAVSKSFLIPHPTPAKAAEGKKLRYASLEGPENGVYYRGRLEGESEIVLPDYWKDLVDPESITVNLTARKFAQPSLFVVDANAEKVIIESDREINCDFVVYGTRKDIAKLEVEPDGE